MKLTSWPTLRLKIKLFLVDTLRSYYLALFFLSLSLLPFSISKIVFHSQKTVYHCLLYYSGSPAELWGSRLILFSWNEFENSAQMDWDKLVTCIRRGGRRCWGDFYPGVSTGEKFRKDQSHWSFLNFPCRISIWYLFSISYWL